jgi:hypothetical protein
VVGDGCKEGWASVDFALIEGDRVLSSYKFATGTIWIITEADRSVTTFLKPEDY